MARAIWACPASSGWIWSMARRFSSPLMAVLKASVEVRPRGRGLLKDEAVDGLETWADFQGGEVGGDDDRRAS